MASAGVSCLVYSRDSASSCQKCTAHAMSTLSRKHRRLLQAELPCALHQNDLVKTALLSAFMPIVSGSYGLARLCRYGINFTRVVHAVPQVMKGLKVVPSQPPPLAAAFANEVLHYASLHYHQPTKASKKTLQWTSLILLALTLRARSRFCWLDGSILMS